VYAHDAGLHVWNSTMVHRWTRDDVAKLIGGQSDLYLYLALPAMSCKRNQRLLRHFDVVAHSLLAYCVRLSTERQGSASGDQQGCAVGAGAGSSSAEGSDAEDFFEGIPFSTLCKWLLGTYYLHPEESAFSRSPPASMEGRLQALFQDWLAGHSSLARCVEIRQVGPLSSGGGWEVRCRKAFPFSRLVDDAPCCFQEKFPEFYKLLSVEYSSCLESVGNEDARVMAAFFSGAEPFHGSRIRFFDYNDFDKIDLPCDSTGLLRRGGSAVVYNGVLSPRCQGVVGFREVVVKVTLGDSRHELRHALADTLHEASLLLAARSFGCASVAKLVGILWAPVYGTWSPCLVLKRYGESLVRVARETLHARVGPPSVEETRRFMEYVLDIAVSLAALHSAGIVHGDVALRNCLLKHRTAPGTSRAKAVLCDFGHSVRVQNGTPPRSRGLPRVVPPGYRDDETSPRAPDDVSDRYQFGFMLMEAFLMDKVTCYFTPHQTFAFDVMGHQLCELLSITAVCAVLCRS
jgi:hypothetical protein